MVGVGMSRRGVFGGLLFGLTLAVAGCSAPPPVRDLDLAKSSFDKAVTVGAEGLAPESFRAAQQAQAALDAEMKAQVGKWFKSYDAASDLALAAQAAADKAVADAVAGAERMLSAAQSATDDSARGPNVLLNGDFSSGLDAWGSNPESDSTVSTEKTGPNEYTWHVKYRKGNWGVIYQERPLKPNTVYVYEAWIKSTAPVVALYWQSDIGRFYQDDHTYPAWTHLRYVFRTPGWTGQPFRSGFNPVLMKGAGEAWLRDLRVWEFKAR